MDRIHSVKLFVWVLIIGLFLMGFIPTAGAQSSQIDNWREFCEDYNDSDDDGEKDNYMSYSEGDTDILTDTIVNYTYYEYFELTSIILESYPDEPMYFWNDIRGTFTFGETIMIWIRIESMTEDDGDEGEDYNVYRLVSIKEDDNQPDTSSDTVVTTPAWGWVVICGVSAIPLIVLVYFFMRGNKKKKLEVIVQPVNWQFQQGPQQ